MEHSENILCYPGAEQRHSHRQVERKRTEKDSGKQSQAKMNKAHKFSIDAVQTELRQM